MKIAHPTLRDYLPQDIDTLNRIGQYEIKELGFVEMTSMSRRISFCKGMYPIFVLPAVHSIMLKPLFRQLHYPVFSATITPIQSIKQTARKLSQVRISPIFFSVLLSAEKMVVCIFHDFCLENSWE